MQGATRGAPSRRSGRGRLGAGHDAADLAGAWDRRSGNGRALYAAGQTGGVSGESLVLHVSDIHSNPLGLELAFRLAESFEVDAVLDTGDLTSFGLPIEASIIELIADLDIPYLWVPSNHDSAAN